MSDEDETNDGAAPGRPDADEPPICGYDGLACDLDGVVYHGDQAVPGAPEALSRMAARGTAVVYVTNNASRLPRDVAASLISLGAPATAESVVTSAQAGAARVRRLVAADRTEAPVVVALGGPGVRAALDAQGCRPVGPEADEAVAVLQGYGPELTVQDFARAARRISDGVLWVATNTDATLPQPWGNAPGNGAYVGLLQAVTGRDPIVVGKPEPPLYDLATERLGAGRALAIGDRLDTDIDGAAAAGLDAAWVLTGVHLPSDLMRLQTALPRYVVAGLAELELPYAAARADGDGWVCGEHTAFIEPEVGAPLRLGGPRPPGIEAVRAGLAALVAARDTRAVPVEDLVAAARQLDDIVTAAR